jgi:hypothetical protein
MFLIIMKFVLSLLSIICALLVPTTFYTVLCIIIALLWFINGILDIGKLRYKHGRKNDVI